jgi:hypothetical protein
MMRTDGEDFSVLVWLNPGISRRPHARVLETLTPESSRSPMAFPTESLSSALSSRKFFFARDYEEVFFYLNKSSRNFPVIINLNLAREALGWDDFHFSDVNILRRDHEVS